MNNPQNVMLITQTRIKPNQNDVFEKALQKMQSILNTFPGYISQEVHRPNPPLQIDWIITHYFISVNAAKAWLQSSERLTILKEDVLPILLGIDNVYIMQSDNHDQGTVTATITHNIDPRYEQKFLEWQLRIAPLQSKFPGFIGYKLEKPRAGVNEFWTAIVTFDTEEHLEAWLASPERHNMLKELHTFTQDERIEKIYSGFNFWFANKESARSVWKENMLVLLTLYPVVFLLSYIQRPAMAYGVPFWLALFFSNLISTVILGNLTVPWLMHTFSWWLNPPQATERKHTTFGTVIVMLLYGASMLLFWLLSSL